MRSNLFKLCAAVILSIVAGSVTTAQVTATKTEVVQNADGTYTVIEYPVGQEVTVNLTPAAKLAGAQGSARVVRTPDGTKVVMNLTGVPGETSSYYAYAVDASGNPTLLGPVVIDKGLGTAEFTTPMNQFMLVLSPAEGWKTVDNTAVVFRSEVPKGYAVVQTATTSLDATKTVAVSDAVTSTYEVPLLNVPSFNNKTTEIRIAFAGDLDGLKGKAYVDPGQKGVTQVKMRFDDMKLAPKDKRFVLWASSADGQYTKLGQVINTGRRQESEIRSETALRDFGLFVTMEETDVTLPTGKTYSVFGLPKQP